MNKQVEMGQLRVIPGHRKGFLGTVLSECVGECAVIVERSPQDAGFLQVRENGKKSGNLIGQEKVRGKYFLGKVRGNEKLVPPDVRFVG